MDKRKKLRIFSKGLRLGDDWPWKPYFGWTVEAVINYNLGYVEWAMSRGIKLDNTAFEYYTYQKEAHDG